MKIDKKVIIIIAVIAVFLWMFLKKNKTAAGTASVEPSDTMDMNYILEHVYFTDDEISSINSVLKSASGNNTYRQQLLAKANMNGINYYQQVALDGVYLVFVKKGDNYQARFDDLRKRILAL